MVQLGRDILNPKHLAKQKDKAEKEMCRDNKAWDKSAEWEDELQIRQRVIYRKLSTWSIVHISKATTLVCPGTGWWGSNTIPEAQPTNPNAGGRSKTSVEVWSSNGCRAEPERQKDKKKKLSSYRHLTSNTWPVFSMIFCCEYIVLRMITFLRNSVSCPSSS